MTDTLRQQITEICSCGERCPLNDPAIMCTMRVKCQTRIDRICEVIKAKVEEMPLDKNPYEYVKDQCPGEYKIIDKAIIDELKACKSYLMEELNK